VTVCWTETGGELASMAIYSVALGIARVGGVVRAESRRRFEEYRVVDDASQGPCLPARSRPG
jgi:hypothetical protein